MRLVFIDLEENYVSTTLNLTFIKVKTLFAKVRFLIYFPFRF